MEEIVNPLDVQPEPFETFDAQAQESLSSDVDLSEQQHHELLAENSLVDTASGVLPDLELVENTGADTINNSVEQIDFTPKDDTYNNGQLFDANSFQIENRNRVQEGQHPLSSFRMEGSQEENVESLENMRRNGNLNADGYLAVHHENEGFSEVRLAGQHEQAKPEIMEELNPDGSVKSRKITYGEGNYTTEDHFADGYKSVDEYIDNELVSRQRYENDVLREEELFNEDGSRNKFNYWENGSLAKEESWNADGFGTAYREMNEDGAVNLEYLDPDSTGIGSAWRLNADGSEDTGTLPRGLDFKVGGGRMIKWD